MKDFPVSLLLVFSLFACQPVAPAPDPVSSAELHERIETKLSVFTTTLTSDRDTIIRTPNDVLVQVPAGVFVDAQGHPVEGEVELQLQEVFTKAQTLLQPISTVTTSGELIASRGMLKIEALMGRQALELGTGKSINLGFPGEKEDYAGYELFYGVEGEDGTIEWEVDSTPADPLELEFIVDPFLDPINWFTVSEEGIEEVFAVEYFFDFVSSINDHTKFTQEQLIRYTARKVRVHFRFFEDGTIGPHTVFGDISKQEKEEVLRRFENLPPLILEGRNDDVQGIFTFVAASAEELEWRKLQAALSKRSLLSVNRLGWTNCDIFLRLNLPVIDMEVARPTDSTLVKLIFTDYKTTVTASLLENGNLKFYGVPEGASVEMVAITPVQDDLELSVTSTTIQPLVKELAPSEKVTEEELIQRLNALN
ncbi:MAG: hypothetical protein AAF840_01435 [Bacteroidota bacterium]